MSNQAASDGSAGDSPAVARATRSRFGSVTIRDRGRLPHWEKEGSIYFVTFRLGDSLPTEILDRIQSERLSIQKTATQLGRDLSADEKKKLKTLSTAEIERYLDAGTGSYALRDERIALELKATIVRLHQKRYRLFAMCIMPNHVHVVVRPFPSFALSAILHSWKSYSSKQANRILGRNGRFWQREYYDHLIRDEGEFERAVVYVRENPVKAGLQDWPWVWVWGQVAPTTAGESPALPGADHD